jgi:hypothetical protein
MRADTHPRSFSRYALAIFRRSARDAASSASRNSVPRVSYFLVDKVSLRVRPRVVYADRALCAHFIGPAEPGKSAWRLAKARS